ncbi:MAG: hypothetical protein AAF383_00740 [Cyanobacteria bacterium P01_A01_bin.83]
MDAEYMGNLKFSESDIIEIYNTVPRTLSQSAMVVSVNKDLSFKPETSGNYWIIQIDSTTGRLFPKRGQIFDKYQYTTLQDLFNCSGYEQHSNKEFIIKKPAQVTFNLDKKHWYRKTQGVLEFGDNSPVTRLRKALNELERLSFNSQQDKLEIESLHNKLEQSQNIANQRNTEIEEFKINHTKLLDLFVELQRDKKYQKEINDNLLEINKKLSTNSSKADQNHLQKNKFSNSSISRIADEINLDKTTIDLNDSETHIDYTSKYSHEDSEKLEYLIVDYNTKTLKEKVFKVAPSRESIEQIRTGVKTSLILKQDQNDSYWVLLEPRPLDDNYYLVPKFGLVINDRIYQTVEDIFICQGYQNRTSNAFKLIRPAIVEFLKNNEWKLLHPGELKFDES